MAQVAQIILDYSANTFKNDKTLIKRGIDEIKKIDTGKHEIVFKTQLFTKAGENIPCTHESFEYLYEYGNSQGYKVTASVFDKESLDYLLKFDIPFVKIANRPDLYWLIGEIKRNIPVYVSVNGLSIKDNPNFCNSHMACVSKYPAHINDYIKNFTKYESRDELTIGALKFWDVSDHTENWDLFNMLDNPRRYECHYKLSDSTGLDAGSFARTPEQLKEIL